MEDRTNNSDELDGVSGSGGGFVKFYGLYWKRDLIYCEHAIIPGIPAGWVGVEGDQKIMTLVRYG